jgi:hypothetical protein
MLNPIPLLPLLPALGFFAAAAATPNPAPELEERYNPFRIPVVHTDNQARQNHPDLEVRQQWLKNAARGLRKKYETHLGERGQELLRRDRIMKRDEERRSSKRATGTVQ